MSQQNQSELLEVTAPEITIPEAPEILPQLKLGMKALNKKHKENLIVRLGDNPEMGKFPNAYTTGSLSLDIAIGVAKRDPARGIITGLPSGCFVEIYGAESCGKTTLCNSIVANAQREGNLCAYIDMEQTWHREYAAGIGVDTDNLLFSQPDYAEQAAEIMEMLIKIGNVGVIIVDSIASLVPKEEFESEITKQQMGLQPRLMAKIFRKLVPLIREADTTVIFTNQIREKIGVMFGNPRTTPGGWAVKHNCMIRIEMRKAEEIKNEDAVVGHLVKCVIVKNKAALPKRNAEFRFMYLDGGVDKLHDIVTLGVEFKIVKKAGSWYSYNGDMIGQGKEAIRDWLNENPVIVHDIREEIMKRAFKMEENEQEEQVDE